MSQHTTSFIFRSHGPVVAGEGDACSLLMFHSKIKHIGIVVLLSIFLGGCMWMPAARDDFSVLGNDPFSDLIRGAYSEKNLNPGSTSVGVSQIDRRKANRLARELLLGKTSAQVIELFNQEGGRCLPLSSDSEEKLLTCEVSRYWKLKNIGAPFDTSNWSDPAANLIFKIVVSDAIAMDLDINVIDITVKKPVYSR